MDEQFVSAKLSREDLIQIIRNIPDTVIAYDRDGSEIARSNIVVRHNQKRNEMAAEGGKTQVQIKQSHWEYSLMPIWILTYRDRQDRTYTYAMNGYTGKVYGELPISYPKLGLLLGAIALPLTAILTWLGGMLF